MKTDRIDRHRNTSDADPCAGLPDVWHLVRAGKALVRLLDADDPTKVAREIRRESWLRETRAMVADLAKIETHQDAVSLARRAKEDANRAAECEPE